MLICPVWLGCWLLLCYYDIAALCDCTDLPSLLCHVWANLRFVLLCSGAFCRASLCCVVVVCLLVVVGLAWLLLLRVRSLFGCSELVCILRCRSFLCVCFAYLPFGSLRFEALSFLSRCVAVVGLPCVAFVALRATLSWALLFYILLLCFVVVAAGVFAMRESGAVVSPSAEPRAGHLDGATRTPIVRANDDIDLTSLARMVAHSRAVFGLRQRPQRSLRQQQGPQE